MYIVCLIDVIIDVTITVSYFMKMDSIHVFDRAIKRLKLRLFDKRPRKTRVEFQTAMI